MRYKNMGSKLLAIILIILLVPSVAIGCMAGDPMMDDLYTRNVYPATTDTYDVGSATLRYDEGYFRVIHSDSITGNITETDPIWSASPSFGITAGDIVDWDALISSQWVDDVNGIHYTGGVGIHTNASATGLLALYSSDGISNNPILEVADNSASAEAVGIRVNISGAKTDYADGIYITNIATTNTAGADKYGLRIKNTGNWLGVGSVNYGLYIEEPTGGTTNIAAYIDGDIDVTGDTDIGGDLVVLGSGVFSEEVFANSVNITGTVWEDLRTPINALKLSGVKPPTWTDYKSSQVLAFSDQAVAGNEEEVFFAFQLAHSYKEGTDLYVHPHFVYSANQTNTRVRWGLSYTWANLDDVLPGATTIYKDAILTSNDADVHRLSSFDAIDGTGKKLSSMLLLRFFRNSSNASDNYTADVYLMEIDAHYLIDSMGSSAELIK